MGLWMRFVGMHFWYREFRRPQLEGKAGVSVNIDKVRVTLLTKPPTPVIVLSLPNRRLQDPSKPLIPQG